MINLFGIRLSTGVWMMLIASFSFGIMNVSVKMTPELSAPEMVFFRSLVRIIIGYFTLLKLGISPLGKNKLLLAQRGLFGSLGLLCYFYTLHKMPLGNALTVHYLAPVLTTILAVWMAGEKVIPKQWHYFCLIFIGVMVVNSEGLRLSIVPSDWTICIGIFLILLSIFVWRGNERFFSLKGILVFVTILFLLLIYYATSEELSEESQWPLLAGIGGALFSALAYNTIKKLKGVEDPNVVVLYFPLISVPIALSYFLFKPGDWIWPHGMQWFWIVITGISTQIGQFFMTRAYQEDLASRVSAVSYAGILWGAGAGLFIFGEQYTFLQYLGMLMVILGVILNINANRVKDFFAPGEE